MTLMEKAYFHYKEGEHIPPPLERVAEVMKAADCFVVITPEFNHTLPPGLTNMMNYFGGSVYACKPSGLCTYSAGMWGGARCAVAARTYLSELGCMSVSGTMQVSTAWKAFEEAEDGRRILKSPMQTKSCSKMLGQLEWHAHALRNHRNAAGLPGN